MIKALSIALVLAAACGGKKTEPATSTTTMEHKDGENHEGMNQMPPEITKFHDVIAPRWHAEKGPARMKDTCGAVPEFQGAADALAKATPPMTTNADTWTAGTRKLTESVNALDASCKSNDATTFELSFHNVHESFHGLMEQAGGHKGGEHHEGDHGEHKM